MVEQWILVGVDVFSGRNDTAMPLLLLFLYLFRSFEIKYGVLNRVTLCFVFGRTRVTICKGWHEQQVKSSYEKCHIQ